MDNLFELYIKDVERPFLGWDFSYVVDTGRMVEFPLKWSYTSKVLKKMRYANTFLDMKTGGGEFLSLLQPFPPNSFATEGHPPNINIAKERLEPLGVTVIESNEDCKLDFEDDYFDLIINRQGKYSASEVKRVLNENGYFITQQVGDRNCMGINNILGCETKFASNWNLQYAVSELEDVGLHIVEKYEDFPKVRFFDIGAIVFFLKAVEWQIPDFGVEKYRD